MLLNISVNLCLFFTLFAQQCLSSDLNANLPRGHLQPLGSHADPGSVPEFNIDSMPTPEEFWKNFVKPSKPAVFRGAAKSFGGFTKWTDEYMAEHYGDSELRLEGRKEKFGRTPYGALGVGRDTMRNFVSHYHEPGHKGYIVSELPKTMYHEAGVLPFMTCGNFRHRMVEVDFWLNGGNASSVLHKDAFNTMNCLLNGTKEWKLIELAQEKNIYKAWEAAQAHGGYSKINVNSVDLLKYPKVAKVPWQYTKLEKGDCFFLPKGLYHNVLSYGESNVAVALLFSRFDQYKKRNLDFSDCDNITKVSAPLSEFIVDWEYPGIGDLSMGNADLEDTRRDMLNSVNKAGIFTLKRLTSSVRKIYSEKDKTFVKDFAAKSYKSLTGGTGELTRDMIKKFTKEMLRTAALCFERVDPSNARWNEYNQVSPDMIIEILLKSLKKKSKGVLSREEFLKIYVDAGEGSPVYGNRFFDILAGPGENSVTKQQVTKNLDKATEKYFEHQVEGEEAASPEIYQNAKKPAGYDEGDVDKIYEEERKERTKRYVDDEDEEGKQEEGSPEGNQEEGNQEEGSPEEDEEDDDSAGEMEDGENLQEPEVVKGNENDEERYRDEL